jgi:GntR family transcriptional regulator of arabinose operon
MIKISDIVLDPDSIASLHAQLHTRLRQLILSGQWPEGSRIPSENQFAVHLKVSRSTVRLALQKAEIEGLIERMAGRGTFVANVPSQSQHKRHIAFITYGFDSESQLMMLKGAESAVKAYGYQIILSNVQSQQEEFDILQHLKAESVAGVLLWPNANASHTTPRSGESDSFGYQHIHLPLVLMDRQIYGIDCDCVTSDNYSGAMSLMQHLIELGHQHIAFLSHHEMELLPVKERYRAYRDALQNAQLQEMPPCLISEPGFEIGNYFTFRGSLDLDSTELRQIRDYLLNTTPRPTAIFAINDYLAILAVRTLKLLQFPVPESVSVAGFDDIDLAAHLEVPLTTVAQDAFLIGRHAAQRLISRLDGYDGPAECVLIPTELRIRSSTSVPTSTSIPRKEVMDIG